MKRYSVRLTDSKRRGQCAMQAAGGGIGVSWEGRAGGKKMCPRAFIVAFEGRDWNRCGKVSKFRIG